MYPWIEPTMLRRLGYWAQPKIAVLHCSMTPYPPTTNRENHKAECLSHPKNLAPVLTGMLNKSSLGPPYWGGAADGVINSIYEEWSRATNSAFRNTFSAWCIFNNVVYMNYRMRPILSMDRSCQQYQFDWIPRLVRYNVVPTAICEGQTCSRCHV